MRRAPRRMLPINDEEEEEELFIIEKGELGLIQQAPAHIQVDDSTPCRYDTYRYPEKF